MNVYVVNGYPRSGKDTFCNMVFEFIPRLPVKSYSPIISSVELPKHLAKYAGWMGEKTPEARRFLSDLKDLLTDFNDSPFEFTRAAVRRYKHQMLDWDYTDKDITVFIMSREPEDIERYKQEFNAKTIFVRRDLATLDLEISNHADAEVENYNYDIIIQNTGTLDDLREAAQTFCKVEGLVK